MGRLERKYWLSDTWNGRSGGYQAYVPGKIAGLALDLDADTAAKVSAAERAVAGLGGNVGALTDTEPLARLLLRSEAVASSRIEGLEVPAKKLLEVEAREREGRPYRLDGTEAVVLSNIRAMSEGIESALEGDLTVAAISEINRMLLAHTPLAAAGGIVRDQQNWIGGDGYSPLGAAYVPPAPEHVPALLEDLVSFVNESTYSPVVKAAIVHAQFETIHPFLDGNGRTGRALAHAVLRRSGLCSGMVPPVSLVLATDRAGYIERLAGYRSDGTMDERFPVGAIEWISYFAGSVGIACERAAAFEETLAGIANEWRHEVAPRANSSEDLLIRALIGTPVVSVGSASELIGRSYPAARNAIESLVKHGVLVQNSKNRRGRIFVAVDVVDAFTGFERAMSVPGGDTSVELPARLGPQRVPRARRGYGER